MGSPENPQGDGEGSRTSGVGSSERLAFYLAQIAKQIAARPGPALLNGVEPVERTPDRHTIGDFIGAVMSIDNEADAKAFYEGALEYYRARVSTHTATETVRLNIGWCFGEGMSQERIDMWVRACGAFHPVAGVQKPTPEEALAAGKKAGELLRKKGRP